MILLMCNLQMRKIYETDAKWLPRAGTGEGINCKGQCGELLWANGNVLKLYCDNSCTTV